MTTAEFTAPAVSPSKAKRTAWHGTVLCLVLSLVFLTSALAKTRSFSELESTLAASKLVPILMVSQAATLLLVTEYLLALLLLMPPTRRASGERVRSIFHVALDARDSCPLSLLRHIVSTDCCAVHSSQRRLVRIDCVPVSALSQ